MARLVPCFRRINGLMLTADPWPAIGGNLRASSDVETSQAWPGGIEMLRLILRLTLVAGIGMTGAACQDDGSAAPRGYYQPAPAPNPYYNSGYYAPAPAPSQYGYAQPAQYGYAQPAPAYYPNQQGYQGTYNQADGRRYTTVAVTNRGQNGNRDDVVQQQVVCGSQYYDGFRTRTAPRC
jgi:hypothetical protein